MLWMVSTVRVARNSGSRAPTGRRESGANAVCQSLECRTRGGKPREPHVVTGAVQRAGECPGHVREPSGLGERLDLGGEQADGEFLLHRALLRRMPVSLPDACQAIECLLDPRVPVRMPDRCQVMM